MKESEKIRQNPKEYKNNTKNTIEYGKIQLNFEKIGKNPKNPKGSERIRDNARKTKEPKESKESKEVHEKRTKSKKSKEFTKNLREFENHSSEFKRIR